MNGWINIDPLHIERYQCEIRLQAARERAVRQATRAQRGNEPGRLRRRVGARLVVLGCWLVGPAEPCCAECA